MQLTPLEADHAAGLLVKGVTGSDWSVVTDEATREKWRTLARNMASVWTTPRNAETMKEFFAWCSVKMPAPPPERKTDARRQDKAGST